MLSPLEPRNATLERGTMSAFALVAGKLRKSPEGRTSSKTGKAFATAVMREGGGDAVTWWNIVAFADMAAELLKLKGGDVVSVSGPFTVELYAKNGGQATGDPAEARRHPHRPSVAQRHEHRQRPFRLDRLAQRPRARLYFERPKDKEGKSFDAADL